jgi:hypothetical protein
MLPSPLELGIHHFACDCQAGLMLHPEGLSLTLELFSLQSTQLQVSCYSNTKQVKTDVETGAQKS